MGTREGGANSRSVRPPSADSLISDFKHTKALARGVRASLFLLFAKVGICESTMPFASRSFKLRGGILPISSGACNRRTWPYVLGYTRTRTEYGVLQ